VSASSRSAIATRVLVARSEGLIVRILGTTFPRFLAAGDASIVSCIASSKVFTVASAIVRLTLALSGFFAVRCSTNRVANLLATNSTTFNATIVVSDLFATNFASVNANHIVVAAVGERAMLGCMA